MEFMWLGLACGLLGAISFGQEFSNKTIYLMLAQGVSRRRIWYEKMCVLGLALISVTSVAVVVPGIFLINHPEIPVHDRGLDFHLIYLMPLCAFCTGSFLTLVSRNMLAGLIFTVATPSLFLGLLFGAVSYFLADTHIELQETLQSTGINLVLAAYSVALYYCGCKRLESLESTDAFAQDIKFPRVIENSVAWLTEWPGRKWIAKDGISGRWRVRPVRPRIRRNQILNAAI
jgi:ABC-type transport system involved in multi-copper enzyme maturation permease subunit